MNRLVYMWAKAIAADGKLASPIVEIGSFQVAGQEEIAELRPLFPDAEYTGTDMRAGPGVDRVEDVHRLTFADASLATVLMLETLEHVADPRQALSEVRRTLRPDGILVVTTPFALHIHNYPSDYWRFTPEAYHLMLEGFGARLVGSVGPQNDPLFVLGIAWGEACDLNQAEESATAIVARYRALLYSDPILARERKTAQWQHRLSALLPMREARRAYRTRAHFHDCRFSWRCGEKSRDFT